MEELVSLKRENIEKEEDIPEFGIKYTFSRPSEHSKMFRVEQARASSFSFTSIIGKAIIVAAMAAAFTFIERIPHEDLRLITTIGLWIAGAVAWITHSRFESGQIIAESVLAVQGLGLQIFCETKGGEIKNLIYVESPKIAEILIMEGFTAMKVITYIGIELVTVNPKKPAALLLPFQHFELPVRCLVEITKGLRQTIDLDSKK